MPVFFGTRFLARIAKRMSSKSSEKKMSKSETEKRKNRFYEESAGDVAFAVQLQDEEICQQLQFQEFNLDDEFDSLYNRAASSSSSASKNPYPGWVDVSEPEANFLRAFGINLAQELFKKECDICRETLPQSSFISTKGCAHEYCSDCCSQHAEAKIMSGSAQIRCPHTNCTRNFGIDQLQSLLSASNFEILNVRLTEAAIPASLKVYCPHADCSVFMEKSETSTTETFAECYSCHRGFCQACNVPWHSNQTCGEYRAHELNSKLSGDQKLRDLAKQQKWQQCADCHRVIELQRGCHHMTCLCGNEFCYVCGAKWKNKAASCKCKLWDEDRIIAG